jgi:hypothetical protein
MILEKRRCIGSYIQDGKISQSETQGLRDKASPVLEMLQAFFM